MSASLPYAPDRAPWSPHKTVSADGTRLRYWAGGKPGGRALVIAGGVAAPDLWRPLVGHLGGRLRVVSWDPRGLGGSAAPASGRDGTERYALDAQLEDLQAVLVAERIEAGAALGYGLGAPIAVEACSAALGLEALIVACGSAARPVDGLEWGWRQLASLLIARPDCLARALGALQASPLGPRLLAWSIDRLAGRTRDVELLASLSRRLSGADPRALAFTLAALGDHDAWTRLAGLSIPSLVIAAERDPLAAPSRMHQLARELPRSELLTARAGHLLPAELPDLFNLRVERFLEDAGIV